MIRSGLAKRWILFLLAASVVLLTGCGRLALPTPAASPPAEAQTVTVTGYGEARGDPHVLTVEVGVTVSSADISQAVTSANATIEQITRALAQIGIAEKDVQTTGFSVWPEDIYSPVNGSPTGEKTYRLDSSLRVTVRDVDKAGAVLEEAIRNGANNIYGMNFSIQDPSALAARARTAAIEDARVRATQLAQDIGVTLGKVQKASEVSGGPIPMYASMGLGGGEVPVSPGQMTVGISVEVTFGVLR